MRIYITHCSAKKDDSLKHTGKKVTPDKLYTATATQRFMSKCKEKKVDWAIFSDYYGVWFADVKHEWYGDDVGDPNKVTEQKFKNLVKILTKNSKTMMKSGFIITLDDFILCMRIITRNETKRKSKAIHSYQRDYIGMELKNV
jgi:hypothetical protein